MMDRIYAQPGDIVKEGDVKIWEVIDNQNIKCLYDASGYFEVGHILRYGRVHLNTLWKKIC